MRLVLMNTSIWQCHLDGTHATDGWAGLSLPAVYAPRRHLAQKLGGRTDVSLAHSLNALLVPKEREGERGILSRDGELGLRDGVGGRQGQNPGDKSEAGRCCRARSPARLQTNTRPPLPPCRRQPPQAGLGARSADNPRHLGATPAHPAPQQTLSWLSMGPIPFFPISQPPSCVHFYPCLLQQIGALCSKINHLLKYRYFSPWTFPCEWLDIKLIVALN